MAWGLYYGILIALEKAFLDKLLKKLPQIFRHIYLVLIVMIGWVFFRAENITQAIDFIRVLGGISVNPLYNNSFISYINESGFIVILAIIFSTPVLPKIKSMLTLKHKKLVESKFIYVAHSTCLMSIMFIIVVILVNSTYNPFLYFRF